MELAWKAQQGRGSLNSLSPQTQCFNFIRVLVSLNATHLYTCGTFAFSPACTFIVSYWAPSSRTQASLPHLLPAHPLELWKTLLFQMQDPRELPGPTSPPCSSPSLKPFISQT